MNWGKDVVYGNKWVSVKHCPWGKSCLMYTSYIICMFLGSNSLRRCWPTMTLSVSCFGCHGVLQLHFFCYYWNKSWYSTFNDFSRFLCIYTHKVSSHYLERLCNNALQLRRDLERGTGPVCCLSCKGEMSRAVTDSIGQVFKYHVTFDMPETKLTPKCWLIERKAGNVDIINL